MNNRLCKVTVSICSVLLFAFFALKSEPAQAMPNFGQAVGGNPMTSCSLCHTMVPALNAYGRYVQNTYYTGFSHDSMKDIVPIWVQYQTQGNSTRSANANMKSATVGWLYNLTVDSAGFVNPKTSLWTYRVEQELYSQEHVPSSAGPSILWVAYNGLFSGNGHVALGDEYPPEASFMRNPTDLACGFNVRHFGVASHTYNFINDRWGASFHYTKGWLDAEIMTGVASGGLIQSSDFSIAPGSDKATQWKIAYAKPSNPLEIGLVGTQGTYMLKGAAGTIGGPPNVDHYNGVIEYVELDQVGHRPGLFAYNLTTTDSNPGVLQYLGAVNRDFAIEAYEVFGRGFASADLRDENAYIDGTVQHSFTIGLNTRVPRVPYLFARLDINTGHYSSQVAGCSYAGATTHNCQGFAPSYVWALQYYGPLVAAPKRSAVASSSSGAGTTTGMASDLGASLFSTKCSACHGATGQGTPGVFPALAGNQDVIASDPSGIISTVVHGKGGMPSFKGQLSNAEVAAVLTYIRSSWGNSAGPVTEAQVSGIP